jgi:hypothetical protein
MQKLLLFNLLLIFSASFSQTRGNITIGWLAKTEISYGNSKIKVPQFSGNEYQYNASSKTLSYTLKLNESHSFDENNIQITAISYESISPLELGDLDLEKIQNQLLPQS